MSDHAKRPWYRRLERWHQVIDAAVWFLIGFLWHASGMWPA